MSSEDVVKAALEGEVPAATEETKALPLRQYLDAEVVPILTEAMALVSKERPEYPAYFIATYLLRNGKRPPIKAQEADAAAPPAE
eukprot:m.41761 g.41761  ORF g.41761 m.41761 type:complete len:85 (-) comp10607_c0_seq1:1763-2017(-)